MQEAEERQRRDGQLQREREQRERIRGPNRPPRGMSRWTTSARSREGIRGNVIWPPDIAGNPEGVLDVVQLPTGEIMSAEIRKSSGSRAYDDAVLRAILK